MPPGPSRGGPRGPLPPLAVFAPAGLSAAIPSRRVCWWWSWAALAPSPGGGARSRGSRGREGFARSRPSRALWRLRPPAFFLPPPASSWRARGLPLCAHSWWLSAPAPAEGAHRARQPPAGAGGTHTEGDRGGRTNEGRRDRAGKHCRPPGGWFRALPATLWSHQASAAYRTVPPILPHRVSAEGTAGPLGCLYHDDLLSVRFIGHLPLTLPSACGRILSKSVMPPWPAAPYRGVHGFVL